MNVNIVLSLVAVVVLGALAFLGGSAPVLQGVFGIMIPYIAFVMFLGGFIWRIMKWAKSPVPFRIPTTCGQQKSLPWIKHDKLDNPSNGLGVVGRMALEIFTFRSLFRNTKAEIKGDRVSYEWEIWLWVAALAFHYSFLAVLVRHMRFFLEPVPACIKFLEAADGFFQIGLPIVLLSGVVLLAAVGFLFFRRVATPRLRYASLAADYFPLFLIMGIAGTGIYMRYFLRVDVVAIKELTMGLATLHPTIPANIDPFLFVHLFLVCVLFVYFPFSKLMHAGGIFLSPTRNMANNSRAKRHINPWNPDLPFVTYEKYENEFREKMIEAGLPVEKES
ncbi:nitrate reductase subunit gamma [Desulfoluna limicola]|uniref:Nitrate reductase subunit gamma n=1 Tax=Desulfoluna limicola TaxID=2810562 RepID=A0ABM7PLV2_9BACT|nr:sulfate reduction electron transfer complex DsrMKJOP subunit DsrM [Desulfoluna limicola]BCS98347.1 nitrate reductase subunit gamma [Desulfoluna limicola]